LNMYYLKIGIISFFKVTTMCRANTYRHITYNANIPYSHTHTNT
jgi:hypothetical protein